MSEANYNWSPSTCKSVACWVVQIALLCFPALLSSFEWFGSFHHAHASPFFAVQNRADAGIAISGLLLASSPIWPSAPRTCMSRASRDAKRLQAARALSAHTPTVGTCHHDHGMHLPEALKVAVEETPEKSKRAHKDPGRLSLEFG